MNKRQLSGLLVLGIAFFSILAGSLLAPRLLHALPVQIRSRLPISISAIIYTPLPAALPAPISTQIAQNKDQLLTRTITETFDNDGQQDFSRGSSLLLGTHYDRIEPPEELTPTPVVNNKNELTMPPASAYIDGVEIIAQKYNNCGPANLTMVLTYYGLEADQNMVGQSIKPNYEDRNVSPHELVDYVNNSSQLNARSYGGGDLIVVKRILAAGYPVIIEKGLHLDNREGWMGHYLTLIGYDDEMSQFRSKDTFLGPWDDSSHMVSYSEIEEKWHQFNNVFILIYPPEQENDVYSLLPEEFNEPVSMWQHAVDRATELVELDVSNAFSWFNLGSSLTQLGQITGEVDNFIAATHAFDKAREIGLPWRMLWYQFEPYQAYLVAGRIDDVKLLTEVILVYEGGRNIEETYLFRGHALLASGDRDGARQAYLTALELNPSMSAAEEALEMFE